MSDIQQAVREKYGAIAESVTKTSSNIGCCGPTACGCGDPISSNLYSDAETSDLPADAVTASLGCGNPTALLALEPGQTVLDLGSGIGQGGDGARRTEVDVVGMGADDQHPVGDGAETLVGEQLGHPRSLRER